MNPIKRLFTAFLLYLGLILLLTFFVIPDVGELPLVVIVESVIIAPLILLLSFTVDIIVNRKWLALNKIKVIIFYIIIIAYITLNFTAIKVAFHELVKAAEYWYVS